MKRSHLALMVVVAVLVVVAPTAHDHWTSAPRTPTSAQVHAASSKDWTVSISAAHRDVRVGATEMATFVLDNKTGRRIEVSGCPGQDYELVLGNTRTPNLAIVPADYCTSWMSPGIHVVSAVIRTSYDACGIVGSPRCGNPPRMSALPPGTYLTQILLPGARPALPTPAPLRIVITN